MYNRDKPSEDYNTLLDEYKTFHKNSKYFNGICLATHVEKLIDVSSLEKPKSLLDYGCGKGLLYDDTDYDKLGLNKEGSTLPSSLPKLLQLDYYALYDPAYPKHSKLPKGKYDAVICTDVIEHIDEKDIDWILEEIFSYSRKFVLLTIACYKALKTFNNGRNVHVNIKTPEHWKEKLLQLHNKHPHLNIYYSLDVLEDEEAEQLKSITEWKLIERK